jgi:hypothetical protein
MCDLDATERDAILRQINDLDELVARLRASTKSIESRNWMEHDELDQLLEGVTVKAGQARDWVHRKVAATHG